MVLALEDSLTVLTLENGLAILTSEDSLVVLTLEDSLVVLPLENSLDLLQNSKYPDVCCSEAPLVCYGPRRGASKMVPGAKGTMLV